MSFQGRGNGIRIPQGEAAMLVALADASVRIGVLLGSTFPAFPVLDRCIGSETFSSHPPLERVRRALFENISAPIDRNRAAALAFLSEHYFSSYFHKIVGVPFWRWVDLCRITLAASLIWHSHTKIYVIALAVGYRHTDTLRRVFKREFGVTPSHFAALCSAQHGHPDPDLRT